METPDGDIYEGDSFDEIVEQMSQGKMPRPRSLTSYRTSVANRLKRLLGIGIDDSTNESFVKTMIEANLLREL